MKEKTPKTKSHSVRRGLLNKDETREWHGNLSPSSFYRAVKNGDIPRPIFIGSKPMWRVRELEANVENLPRERDVEAA